MADLTGCDQCGKTADSNRMLHWLHVEVIGVETRMFGERGSPWDLCSWDCMAEFAQDQIEKER